MSEQSERKYPIPLDSIIGDLNTLNDDSESGVELLKLMDYLKQGEYWLQYT